MVLLNSGELDEWLWVSKQIRISVDNIHSFFSMRLHRPSTSEATIAPHHKKAKHSQRKRPNTRPSTASPQDFQSILQAIEHTLNQRSTLTPTTNSLQKFSLLRAQPFASHHRSATALHPSAVQPSAQCVRGHLKSSNWTTKASISAAVKKKNKAVAKGESCLPKPKPVNLTTDSTAADFVPYCSFKAKSGMVSPLQSQSIHVRAPQPRPSTSNNPSAAGRRLFKRARPHPQSQQYPEKSIRIDKWQQQQPNPMSFLMDAQIS